MLFSPLASRRTGLRRSGSSAAAFLTSFALAASPFAGLQTNMAHAGDLDYTQGLQADDSSYLRIGLSKTAVIKLPAAVKDVVVGDPLVVDVVIRNKTTAYLFGRSAAQTNIFFFDANGQEVLHLDLEVTLDSKAVKKLIDRTLPGNNIQVDTTGNNVVLKGTAANAVESRTAEELAEKVVGKEASIVNTLKIAEGDQVMLKVKVVELKRSVMKQLGINLTGNVGLGQFGVGFNAGGDGGTATGIFDDIIDSAGARVRLDVNALESEGLATTLAEPNLTAISGAPARFHAGGEFPYRVCSTDRNGTDCTIEFKPFGVSLDFTPTVLSEGRISLTIRTEVSELGQILGGVPSIDTRNAQTSVEIPSGGSMMLAGLIKDVTSQDLDGTPGLRKLPIFGALFNSRSYQKNQSELVVIVTPYIVNPVREAALATPTDGFNEPTDRQGLLFGRLNKVYGTPGKHPKGVYHGKVGYIIE